jgi:hypothetical protein
VLGLVSAWGGVLLAWLRLEPGGGVFVWALEVLGGLSWCWRLGCFALPPSLCNVDRLSAASDPSGIDWENQECLRLLKCSDFSKILFQMRISA